MSGLERGMRRLGEFVVPKPVNDEVCDFCAHPPSWVYEVKSEQWRACEACHELINIGDTDALVARALHHVGGELPLNQLRDFRAWVAELSELFMESRSKARLMPELS